eukprot:1427531-Amphidinium_carterae.2
MRRSQEELGIEADLGDPGARRHGEHHGDGRSDILSSRCSYISPRSLRGWRMRVLLGNDLGDAVSL